MPEPQTDYLGRPYEGDLQASRRLYKRIGKLVSGHNTVDVVGAVETIIADIIMSIASDRENAHEGVDRIANDIKQYITYRMTREQMQREVKGNA